MLIQHKRNLPPLILASNLLILCLSMFEQLLIWVLALTVLASIIRILLYNGFQKHVPGKLWINFLAILCILALFYHGKQLGLLDSMVNLLAIACALKLILLNKAADIYQLSVSVIFLIGCGFITQQSMAFTALYLFLTMTSLISLSLHHAPALKLTSHSTNLAKYVVQAFPVAIIMFVFLPRLPPLWQMPTAKSAQTGLSDRVTPGDLANLAQSDDLAFRAEFFTDIPPVNSLYWRALVLESFDGRSWFQASMRQQSRRQYVQSDKAFTPNVSGVFHDYNIVAESTQQSWLYSLDIAVLPDMTDRENIWSGYTYQLIKKRPMSSDFEYRVHSYPDVPLNQTLASLDKRINLTVPAAGNPRTRRWVSTLREKYTDKQRRLDAILAYFAEQDFRYTLRPPIMQNNPTDQFLFEFRAGFCAHYASAAAYALRLAEIPARMVTGYQGGERGERNYVSVYQYSAHAWVEVWLDDNIGWTRIDPTAIVAPMRIASGLRDAVASEDSFLEGQAFSLAKLSRFKIFSALRNTLADIDFLWSKWILGFNEQRQFDLLENLLGNLSVKKIMYASLTLVLLVAIFVGVLYFPRKSRLAPKTHAVDEAYIKGEGLVGEMVKPKADGEGPLDYARRLKSSEPSSATELFEQLTNIWVSHSFAPAKSNAGEKAKIRQARETLNALTQALKERKTTNST